MEAIRCGMIYIFCFHIFNNHKKYLSLQKIIQTSESMIEYITQEGFDKLMNELHQLLSVERPRIADAIAEARDKGDLSENFEYHAAKREQSKLEGRIDHLKVMLSNARIMEMSHLKSDTVQLFSTVELTDLIHNRKMTYTIVNQIESNFSLGKISIKTPIAQGLLKKKVGDIAEINVPAGILRLRIEKISILQ
jgi:transcription elongation factor GreA